MELKTKKQIVQVNIADKMLRQILMSTSDLVFLFLWKNYLIDIDKKIMGLHRDYALHDNVQPLKSDNSS